jgi:hypothetical protein
LEQENGGELNQSTFKKKQNMKFLQANQKRRNEAQSREVGRQRRRRAEK